jgi:hypothetical protein
LGAIDTSSQRRVASRGQTVADTDPAEMDRVMDTPRSALGDRLVLPSMHRAARRDDFEAATLHSANWRRLARGERRAPALGFGKTPQRSVSTLSRAKHRRHRMERG